VEFPLPEAIPCFDARVRMPILWLTLQIALSDIDSLEYGPTQFVPGSHYSGRRPPNSENPEFQGRGPKPILCKAGDVYLFNHQCWHRGAPNLSDRTRYLMQIQYAQRWADRRFKGFA
jgi:ectoine hydroxylase-related dioxygenase (phytanoyl-CoA dioxygenase family)